MDQETQIKLLVRLLENHDELFKTLKSRLEQIETRLTKLETLTTNFQDQDQTQPQPQTETEHESTSPSTTPKPGRPRQHTPEENKTLKRWRNQKHYQEKKKTLNATPEIDLETEKETNVSSQQMNSTYASQSYREHVKQQVQSIVSNQSSTTGVENVLKSISKNQTQNQYPIKQKDCPEVAAVPQAPKKQKTTQNFLRSSNGGLSQDSLALLRQQQEEDEEEERLLEMDHERVKVYTENEAYKTIVTNEEIFEKEGIDATHMTTQDLTRIVQEYVFKPTKT